jgi:dolichol-phosphate mannosyltransferase
VTDTLVIIPTYNERENIEALIELIHATNPAVHIVVSDDQSPDGTGQAVSALSAKDGRIHLLPNPGRVGYGRAVLAGFQFALDRGYRRVVSMDADFSHDPKYMPDMLAKLDAGAHLVVGSRYIDGTISVVNWPLRRLVLSLFANRYVRTITGLPLSDCTSGYRAIAREVLEAIDFKTIRSNGYSFISEVNWRAHRRGFRLAESPIIFVERRKGGSKMSFKVMLEAAFMPWRLRIFG